MSERSPAAPRSEERYANRVVAWAGVWRGAWRPDRRNGRRRWDGCRTSRRSVAHAPIRARRKRYVRCCQWEPRNDAAPSKNVSVHTITDAHPPGGTVAEGNGVVRSPDTTAPPSAHILARQRTGTLSGREQLRVYGVDADGRLVTWCRPLTTADDQAACADSTSSTSAQPRWSLLAPLTWALHRLFLPRNYPHTVADCYAAYAQWHFVHNALTACNAVLATTSLLFAAGLGRTDLSASAPAATVASIPVTAATLWVLKDGVGHLARLLYASRYGHAFDGDLKRFRMLGDVLWHAGTALELLCRLRPDWFLLLASGGNALKGMAHVVFSSTRSTIHRTLATASNIGDVTAKGDAQSIAAELLGIAGGIAVNHAIAEHGAATAWTAFTAVVAMQLVCRYQSMRVLVLPSLNFQRAVLLADAYVQAVLSGGGGDAEAAVPSPTEVAARERVLHWRTLWSPVRGIRPDVPLSAFDGESESLHRGASSLQRIWSACHRERFVVGRLSPSITPGLFPFGDRPRVGFAMKTDASATDTLRALMASLYLLRCPQATESEAIAAVAPPRTASFFARCHHLGWSLDVVHGFGHRNGVQCEAETNG